MNEEQNEAMADYWLSEATTDLCEEAQTRIAAEIKAHYHESIEAHLATGMAELEARLKAYEDLGDPKVAARSFRKKHLTKSEKNYTTVVTPPPMGNLFLYVFVVFFIYTNGLPKYFFIAEASILTAPFLFPQIIFTLKKQTEIKIGRHLILISNFITNSASSIYTNVWMSFLYVRHFHNSTAFRMVSLIMWVAMISIILSWYRLSRKLDRHLKLENKTSRAA